MHNADRKNFETTTSASGGGGGILQEAEKRRFPINATSSQQRQACMQSFKEIRIAKSVDKYITQNI